MERARFLGSASPISGQRTMEWFSLEMRTRMVNLPLDWITIAPDGA
jgi:hypothetical protein